MAFHVAGTGLINTEREETVPAQGWKRAGRVSFRVAEPSPCRTCSTFQKEVEEECEQRVKTHKENMYSCLRSAVKTFRLSGVAFVGIPHASLSNCASKSVMASHPTESSYTDQNQLSDLRANFFFLNETQSELKTLFMNPVPSTFAQELSEWSLSLFNSLWSPIFEKQKTQIFSRFLVGKRKQILFGIDNSHRGLESGHETRRPKTAFKKKVNTTGGRSLRLVSSKGGISGSEARNLCCSDLMSSFRGPSDLHSHQTELIFFANTTRELDPEFRSLSKGMRTEVSHKVSWLQDFNQNTSYSGPLFAESASH